MYREQSYPKGRGGAWNTVPEHRVGKERGQSTKAKEGSNDADVEEKKAFIIR